MKKKRKSREVITGACKKVFAVVLTLLLMVSGGIPAFGHTEEYECLCEEYGLCLEEEGIENPEPAGGNITPVPFGPPPRQVYVVQNRASAATHFTDGNIILPNNPMWENYDPPSREPSFGLIHYVRPRYGFSLVQWRTTLSNTGLSTTTTASRQLNALNDYYTNMISRQTDETLIAHFIEIEIDAASANFGTRIVGYSPIAPRQHILTNATIPFESAPVYFPHVDITSVETFPPTGPPSGNPNFYANFQSTQSHFYFYSSGITTTGQQQSHYTLHIVYDENTYDDFYVGVETGLGIGRHRQIVEIIHGPIATGHPVGKFRMIFNVMRPVVEIDLYTVISAGTAEATVVTDRNYDSFASTYTIASETSVPITVTHAPIPSSNRIEVVIQRPCIHSFFDQNQSIDSAYRDNDNDFILSEIYITAPSGFVEVPGTRSLSTDGSSLTVVFEPISTTGPPPPTSPPITSPPTSEPEPEPTQRPAASPRPTPTPTPEPSPDPISGDHHAFIIGFTDGYIRPNHSMTRAQAATVFFRLMSDEDRAYYWHTENDFSDISYRRWFNNAISTTTNAGIFTTTPDTPFRPNDAITRGEFAAAASKFMGLTPVYGESLFRDTTGHWTEPYINAITLEGWVLGVEGIGGRFMPNGHITRAEVAALMNRALGRLPYGTEALLPSMIHWPDNTDEDAWYFLYIQEASNSHYFIMTEDGIHETWEELIEPRRWYLLERPYSKPEDINQ
ncbi:MAG: S-layer homology domain-containing protein [Defluviitaleaceae bacterium]|nr:S-layer homology domain-containing protein [Defluviitaleaceae bacterium]